MLQFVAEFWPKLWPAVVMALWCCGLISGGLLVGLIQHTQQRNSPMNPEELQRHSRQQLGGTIFRDLLWEMQGEEERRQRKFLSRMAEPNTSDDDRRIYAEEVATCQRNLDRIYRMLMMRDPN